MLTPSNLHVDLTVYQTQYRSREVYSMNYEAVSTMDQRAGRCEMDSHADTCVAGANCTILEYTGRFATVEAYSPDYPSKEIPIATVATAYDCPTSGESYVLILNEALYFGETLSFSLLSSNQLRDNDIHVDERHPTHAPDSIFGIYIPSISLSIPFDIKGVVAGFLTRAPTDHELESVDCHVDLTSDVEWDPHTFALSLNASAMKVAGIVASVMSRRAQISQSRITKYRLRSCMEILQPRNPVPTRAPIRE